MNAQQEATISTLRHLIETARDGQEGFRKAAEYIDGDPELKMLLSSLSLQRAKFAGELESISITMGEHSPDTGSSVSGSLHRWWIDLRASMTKDDNHAILSECERGEDIAVHAYNTALEHELPHPVKEIILRQRREVVAAHNTIRALRDATPGTASKLLAAAKERSDRATHEAHQALSKAVASGQDWMEEGKEQLKAQEKEVRRLARRNPFLLLGGGILAGLALGLLMHAMERRRLHQKGMKGLGYRMGNWMDDMKGKAQSKAKYQAEHLKSRWS